MHQNAGSTFNFAVVDGDTALYNINSSAVGSDKIGKSMLLLCGPHV